MKNALGNIISQYKNLQPPENLGYTIYSKTKLKKFTGIKIGKTTLIETMTLKRTKPFRSDIYEASKKYVNALKIAIKSPTAIGGQRIYWAVNQSLDPGAYIERIDGDFIVWSQLKKGTGREGNYSMSKDHTNRVEGGN